MDEKISGEEDLHHETDDESLIMPSFNRVRDNYLKRIENELKITSSSQHLHSTLSSSSAPGGFTPWNNLLLLVFSLCLFSCLVPHFF
jgi:hypothetical protein